MSTPPNATLAERAEGLLGIGEPKPRSRLRVAGSFLLAALSMGVFFGAALSGGGWRGDEAFFLVGWAALFLALWILANTGGSLLYARGGAPAGRGLRVLGYAVFLPSAMGFWLVHFWFLSTSAFVVGALFVGSVLVQWAVRLAKAA